MTVQLKRIRVLCGMILGIGLLFDTSFSVSRFNQVMDDGTTVTVDNNSMWSDAAVGVLVYAADRSTRDACPYDSPDFKGLFKTGDRVFVNNNYIAWFDFSKGEGVPLTNNIYYTEKYRSGALAGWWTLNPATGTFKNWKTVTGGCWNWPPNELIPGSASPRQEQHWWDAYGPALEHTMEIVAADDTRYVVSTFLARNAAQSGYQVLADGTSDASGVHYKTKARMAGFPNPATSWDNTYDVDITDGDDSNGIASYIDSEVEYICQSEEVRCIWKFRSVNQAAVLKNIYIFIWTGYAQDEDGTTCDLGGGGDLWPSTVPWKYVYTKSSLSLTTTWAPITTYSPGTIVKLAIGPTCPTPYLNRDINSGIPVNNSWIRCGTSSGISYSYPLWTFKNIGIPGAGSGTQSNPINFTWNRMLNWNETHDGTMGMGIARGPYPNPPQWITLPVGVWYKAEFTLRTNI